MPQNIASIVRVSILCAGLLGTFRTIAVRADGKTARSELGFRSDAQLLDRGFRDENLWRNKLAHDQFLDYLKYIRRKRPPEFAPLLARHVSWTTTRLRLGYRIRFADEIYPAYSALKSIGIVALPPILKRLRDIQLVKPRSRDIGLLWEYERRRLERNLLCSALGQIYEEAGFGYETAIRRIETAIATSKDPVRSRLTAVLEVLRAKARLHREMLREKQEFESRDD